jgi:hypothetical protein
MNRIERARLVRDALFSRSGEWEMARIGDTDVASLEWRSVRAVLWSYSSFATDLDSTPSLDSSVPGGRRIVPPYVLDLWIEGSKVLSMTWDTRDQIKLIRMMRGEWETDLFRLPPPVGKSRPSIH